MKAGGAMRYVRWVGYTVLAIALVYYGGRRFGWWP